MDADGIGTGRGEPMMSRLQTFVVRWWLLRNGEQRIEIEHIQSRETRLTRSASEALDWMSAHSTAAPPPQPEAGAERHERSDGTTPER
jgi:hypothetical protein